jgi:hypothetical protein
MRLISGNDASARGFIVFVLLSCSQAQSVFAQAPPVTKPARGAVVPPQVVTRTQLPPNILGAISKSDAVIVGASAPASNPTVPAAGSANVVPPAAATVTLHRGEFLAAPIAGRAINIRKTEAAELKDSVSVNSFFALPERIIGLAADSDLVYLRPAYLPQGALRYVPSISLFRGAFSIGLEDSVRSRERRELSGDFRFQFGGDADSLAPRELAVNHTNLPLNDVTVLARDPADSLLVRIITAANVQGTSVWIRAIPALRIGLLPGSAQGLGLQRIPVTVSVLGTRRATPIAVKLSTDRGTLEPDTVLVGSGMITTVSWRTEGLGLANIQAHAIGADDGSGTVNFIFPFVFLIAAVLGGAAGAALKALQSSKPSDRPMLKSLGIGMLGGVIAAVVYYAIGVSILQVDVHVPFFNEAAVFSLGVLAGLLGVSLSGSKAQA